MFEKERTRICSAMCTSYQFFPWTADAESRGGTWPKLRYLLRDSRAFRGGLRGSAGVSGMAVAAALTVVMALLPAGLASKSNSESLTLTCKNDGLSQQQTVTAANTVLTVVCPASWAIEPSVKSPQDVCENADCTRKVPLTNYSQSAVAVKDSTTGMKITFGELPQTSKTFYLQCKEGSSSKKCDAKVILNKPAATLPGETEPGTPSVQICEQKNASITLKIPEKGSLAQFACERDFNLYPTEADKVFSKDCKTKETLSGMTRTQTPAAKQGTDSLSSPSQPYSYTLKADVKPSKKTLCYLCAKKGTTEKEHGTAANYCTIYVESGARTQLDLILTFVFAFPCVLAALRSN